MTLLALSLALAQTPSPVLVDQAVARIETGDYDGALILLETSLGAPQADPDRIAYLRGVTQELGGDPALAVDTYTMGLETWPDSPLTDDRLFRSAEATATLGDARGALRILRKLDRDAFQGTDALKLELVTGIAWLAAGKQRKGTGILGPALAAAEADQVPFYRAKARVAWARILAQTADDLSLRGRERKVVARLEQRAQLLSEVEQQVTAAARLQEPEWVLEGLLVLGRSYEAVADDLLTSTRPRSLTAEQLATYDALLQQRATVVYTKASRHYGSGLDLATRLAWESRRVGQLQEAKEALDARIEALNR